MLKLDFLGIGAQKSATSWLFQCLRSHPELCLPEEKELHFFSRDELYAEGIGWYESRFAGCGNRTRGEISTSYLSSPEAPTRIHAVAPHIRLIVLLRDPRERAVSHIRHLVSRRELPRGVILRDAITQKPEIFENGRYGAALSRYFAIFPREQICIEKYESVRTEPRALIRRIFRFLSVRDDVVPPSLHMRYNASSFRASKSHGRIHRVYFTLKKIPGWQAVRSGMRALGISAPRVADAMARASKGSEELLFSPTVDEWQLLTDMYTDDMHLLAEKAGIDIVDWQSPHAHA